MSTRFYIAALLAFLAAAVGFGAGVAAVLTIPELNANAAFWLPVAFVIALAAAPFIGWALAPTLRAKH